MLEEYEDKDSCVFEESMLEEYEDSDVFEESLLKEYEDEDSLCSEDELAGEYKQSTLVGL